MNTSNKLLLTFISYQSECTSSYFGQIHALNLEKSSPLALHFHLTLLTSSKLDTNTEFINKLGAATGVKGKGDRVGQLVLSILSIVEFNKVHGVKL